MDAAFTKPGVGTSGVITPSRKEGQVNYRITIAATRIPDAGKIIAVSGGGAVMAVRTSPTGVIGLPGVWFPVSADKCTKTTAVGVTPKKIGRAHV